MEERALEFVTYYEKQLEISQRFKIIRKNRKVSQQRLSELSGVSYASIDRIAFNLILINFFSPTDIYF